MTVAEIVIAARARAAVRADEARVAAAACDGDAAAVDTRDAFNDVAAVLDRLAAALPPAAGEEVPL